MDKKILRRDNRWGSKKNCWWDWFFLRKIFKL